MTIKTDVDAYIDLYPRMVAIAVNCSPRGGNRIFPGAKYRGRDLFFCGESIATKKRKEAEREQEFKAAQQSLISDDSAQA